MSCLRPDRDDYTIGWICALPVELKAARAMLDEQYEMPMQRSGDNNSYTVGRIGVHNVVIAVLPAGRIGTNPASTIGSDMNSSFPNLRFGLMVGIGGGVPSEKNDIRLGDVVVSVPVGRYPGVIQYDMGKALANDVFEPTGFLNLPPPIVLTTVNTLRSLEREKLLKYLSVFDVASPSSENPHPGSQQDQLYRAEYSHRYPSEETCKSCDINSLVARPIRDDKPFYHYGTIASGNLVIKDGLKRDQLEKEHGILCFEMEAAGLMNTFPCLVIRGICDYSDSHKNKRWQPYAAATAAAYAKVLLEHIPPSPHLSKSDPSDEKVDIKGKDRQQKEAEVSILSDIIPLKTPKFFGRRSELGKMHQYLGADSDGPKIVVLYGLGGFGKTQLALHYWTEAAEEYTSRIWVDATSLETALESFKDISTKLGRQLPHATAMRSPASVLSASKAIFADVKKWLSSLSNCRWLMVIDNVEDLDGEFHIRDLIPNCLNGHIIVISTQSETVDVLDAKSIEIAKIDDEAGVEILLHRFKKTSQSEEVKQLVQDIVVKLEGVPLAIEQAGAYLSIYRNLSANVLRDFVGKLQSEYDKIMRTIPKRSKWYYEKHRSIVDTFSMLREALARSNEDADKILTLSAFLAPGNIPISIFSATEQISSTQDSAGSAPYMSSAIDDALKRSFMESDFLMWIKGLLEDKRSYYAAITALESFCCASIRWNVDGTEILSYSIHNAVRLWCQQSWQIEDKDKWALLAAYQLGQSLGRDEGAAVVSRQRYLWHVRYSEEIILRDDPPSCIKSPESPLWALSWSTAIQFAKFYKDQHYLTESQLHLQKAIEFEKLAMKDAWPNLAISIDTLHLLAHVFWQSGRFDEAVETFKTLLEASKVVWGSDGALTLKIAEESSRVRLQALDNARDWNRAVLATNQDKLARDRPDYTPTSSSAVRDEQIDAEINESDLKSELEESISLLGEQARDTIAAKDKLAKFYSERGRFEDAEPLAEAVWEFRMKNWKGKPDEIPALPSYLSPFYIYLAGHLAKGSPAGHLIQEFPCVLQRAIQSKHDQLIEILLREDVFEPSIQSYMVSVVDSSDESPLHKAMIHYEGEQLQKLVDQLLSRGADITYQTAFGSSLLHLAVAREQDIVVQMLLDRGADIEGRNLSIGATALHYAVFNGNAGLVEKLLGWGADLEAKMIEGITALHLAVLVGYQGVVKSLLDHGANPNVQTQLGAGAVHMFVVAELFQSYLRDPDLHQTLENDYIESKNAGEIQFGTAILTIAREHKVVGYSLTNEWILCYGKKAPFLGIAYEPEKKGRSILQDLLDSRAYIDLRCLGLSTPLHLALAMASDFPVITNKAQRLHIIKELIQSGADLTARDALGMIPSTFNLEIGEDDDEEESDAEAEEEERGRDGDDILLSYESATQSLETNGPGFTDETGPNSAMVNEDSTLSNPLTPRDNSDRTKTDTTTADLKSQPAIPLDVSNGTVLAINEEPLQAEPSISTSHHDESNSLNQNNPFFEDLYDVSD